MIKIDSEVLKECANNLKFELEEKQLVLLAEEFQSIVAQMSFLADISGIDEVEPMTFPYKAHHKVMEEDIPVEPSAVETVLSNTKNRLGNQVRIPKVLG